MTAEYQEIISRLVQRWESSNELDNKLTEFSQKFAEWFKQIPEEAKPTVLRLLDNFHYYSHREANRWLVTLHNKLIAEHNVLDEDSIYLFIKSKDGISNSSNDYWTEYKLCNSNVNRNIFIGERIL